MLGVWDRKNVGVRISPTVDFNDMSDDNPLETFSVAVEDSTTLGSVTSMSLKGRRTAKEAPRRLSHIGSPENTLERSLRCEWRIRRAQGRGSNTDRSCRRQSHMAARFWPIQIYQGGCNSGPL